MTAAAHRRFRALARSSRGGQNSGGGGIVTSLRAADAPFQHGAPEPSNVLGAILKSLPTNFQRGRRHPGSVQSVPQLSLAPSVGHDPRRAAEAVQCLGQQALKVHGPRPLR